jgi:hypothetical protein
MPSHELTVWLFLAALYVVFLAWYRGSRRPLTPQEIDHYLAELGRRAGDGADQAHLADVERLVRDDDGREFVMQNLIRYRPSALYPPGHDYGPSAVAADRRYGKAIVPYLLRYGNVPVFIARRCGEFLEPAGIDRWDVVAMVRYRSRRDFLRFAVAATRDRITVHKWAAIESTQVFPVTPIVSLVLVRGAVGVLLAAIGLLLTA